MSTWKSADWLSNCMSITRLYHKQDFVVVDSETARIFSKQPMMTTKEWNNLLKLVIDSEDQSKIMTLVVPSVPWSLNIVLVSKRTFEDMVSDRNKTKLRITVQSQGIGMMFSYEEKHLAVARGITLSSWILGDPQVSATRVHYEYVQQYINTYDTGYGSRIRSTCLDSVNSYRDKRFTKRAHPSPFIRDEDIADHQYFSCEKQRYCLLQMKLESVLHSLATDASSVAERANPFFVRATDRLASKLIATSGKSLFAFFNGLHVDAGDRISKTLKQKIFPDPLEDWQRRILSFRDVSFPTTCGYQHVWKDSKMSQEYDVMQHFVMPGLGVAVILKDSICHHFMGGGAFSHCTGLCLLKSKMDSHVLCNNKKECFYLFAWGNSVNSRTARGNIEKRNSLANHREKTTENRNNSHTTDKENAVG